MRSTSRWRIHEPSVSQRAVLRIAQMGRPSLTATLVAGIRQNPAVPHDVRQQAEVQLSGGVPFLSDADFESTLKEAGVTGETAAAIVHENAKARLRALRAALAGIGLVAAAALFFSGTIPTRQPGSAVQTERGPPDLDPALA